MGKSKDLAKTAKVVSKDAQKKAKGLKKSAKLAHKRAAKGYRGMDSELKASILKKVVFVVGVLAFVAYRAGTRTK